MTRAVAAEAAAYEPRGVIPAALLPFHADLSIDEAAFLAHLRDLAAVEGVTAVTVNAHASEVASCGFEEQRRVLAAARDELGPLGVPVVNDVYADGSLEAARLAGMAAEGGAAALLVFPPAPFALGQSAEMALAHLRRAADAAPGLPIILFQYPMASRQG
ncbi:MAG: dihydrodipicolinate synthase family protein, partial [Acetobacteraceae bacterium]|nr:dihydrodipicolinate synthase family protein [Acetobacteraceae bacterium]